MSPRFFLDEDVQVFLAEALRARGIDAVHAYDVGRGGETDESQLAFAAAERRCIVTYNRRDFIVLSIRFAEDAMPHSGVIVAVRRSPGDMVRSLVSIAASNTAASLGDRLLYV